MDHSTGNEVAIIRTLDDGLSALTTAYSQDSDGAMAAALDLKTLASMADGRDLIAELPPQALYFAIKSLGLQAADDILPLMTGEQFTRILDYDTWPNDVLDQRAVLTWLKAFGAINQQHMFLRFMNLEEEYQLATLDKLLRVYSEEDVETMHESAQDALHAMPCHTVFYEIVSDDAEVVTLVQQLIDAALAQDLKYAYALIAHAAYAPPNEAAGVLAQFRKARLEEDGFVSFEEGQQAFLPLNLAPLRARWPAPTTPRAGGLAAGTEGERGYSGPFWVRLTQAMHENPLTADETTDWLTRVGFLANSLAAAARVEPGQPAALRQLMTRATALVSLGLEYLAYGDAALGTQIVRRESPHTLFRVGLSLVQPLREALTTALKNWHPEAYRKFQPHIQHGRWGAALRLIDQELAPKVGLITAETLRGVFNRFPLVRMSGGGAPHSGEAGHVRFAPLDSLAGLTIMAAHVAAASAFLRYQGEGQTKDELADMIATVALPEELSADPVLQPSSEAVREAGVELLQEAESNFGLSLEDL